MPAVAMAYHLHQAESLRRPLALPRRRGGTAMTRKIWYAEQDERASLQFGDPGAGDGWTPYLEMRQWRRRFWVLAAYAAGVTLLLLIAKL